MIRSAVLTMDVTGRVNKVEFDFDGERTEIPCRSVTVKWDANRRPASIQLDLAVERVRLEGADGKEIMEMFS